jgi:hypothetical protein
VRLDDLSSNWPGSTEKYVLGGEGRQPEKPVEPSTPTVLRSTASS